MRPARHPGEMELQIALDVVHSLRRVYAAAVAAFRCAVGHGRGDMRAWNKLGATVACGGESDDVLHLYQMAMDLCPLYTGAWVNVEAAHGQRSANTDVIAVLLACAFAQMFIAVGKMLASTI